MSNAPSKGFPCASVQIWRRRQDLIQRIRSFFLQRGLLEVETPLLSASGGTDPHLDFFSTPYFVDGAPAECSGPEVDSGQGTAPLYYLMTSPEFHMKRLLAAGWGPIFQIGKAFRNGEFGGRHNPEFTMLEWYRPQWDMEALMGEVAELLGALGIGGVPAFVTWREVFEKYAGLNPFAVSIEECETVCRKFGWTGAPLRDRDEGLDFLLAVCIEPELGKQGPEFLMEYPAHRAALAQTYTSAEGIPLARRFELYLHGVELCNGYQELCDAGEQARRFALDIEMRQKMGKRIPQIDSHFLAALESGMPDCSGVALGVDRLVALILGEDSLSSVLLFPWDRA